jgi:hypothetical protein
MFSAYSHSYSRLRTLSLENEARVSSLATGDVLSLGLEPLFWLFQPKFETKLGARLPLIYLLDRTMDPQK